MAPLRLHYVSHGYPTGYGTAGFRLVEALLGAGVHLRWTPIDFDPRQPLFAPSRPCHSRLDAHRQRAGPFDVTVVHAVPEVLPALGEASAGAPVVCHTVWEADQLQAHWPDLLNRCAGVVVPTEWNAEVFRSSGVTVPVEVVPHVAAAPHADTRWLSDAASRFVVYSIAAWEPRKTPWRSIEAYARAFSPTDDVLYVLKSSPGHDHRDPRHVGPPTHRRETSWAMAMALRDLGAVPPVHLEVGVLTDEEIQGLHQRGDCYLSLPHAEGWDIGAFDAAVAGTPVITTGWGAPAEYLDPAAATLVPVTVVPVEVPPDPPRSTMRWAEPDLDAAVEALRAVRADPEAARRRAAGQARSMARRYAPAVVAEQLLRALERILGR